MLKHILNDFRENQFGNYKVVSKIEGKRGSSVQLCYSVIAAKQAAAKARQDGMTAQIYVEGKDGWEAVDGK